MACLSPDGTLTVQASAVLTAFLTAKSPEEAALTTDLPLFRVRSSVRELIEAGLLEPEGDAFRVTGAGRSQLDATSEPAATSPPP